MQSTVTEYDLYQSVEHSYETQYIVNQGTEFTSGSTITINFPANESKVLSLESMVILGKVAYTESAAPGAKTLDVSLWDPMHLFYVKSFTINGQQLLFQPQTHDGRLRNWLKFDIGKHPKNLRYDSVLDQTNKAQYLFQKRASQYVDTKQEFTFEAAKVQSKPLNFMVNLSDLIPSLVTQIQNIPLQSGIIQIQLIVAQPYQCLALRDDESDVTTSLENAVTMTVTDLTLFNKYYIVRPGLGADQRLALEYQKPHDIFIQHIASTAAAPSTNFSTQIVTDHDFIKYVVCFVNFAASERMQADIPANFKDVFSLDVEKAHATQDNLACPQFATGFLPKFNYAYMQVGSKRFPATQLVNTSSADGLDTYNQQMIALQQIMGYKDALKIDRNMFEHNCGFLLFPMNNEALQADFVPTGSTLEFKIQWAPGKAQEQGYKMTFYVCCRQTLKGSTVHRRVTMM